MLRQKSDVYTSKRKWAVPMRDDHTQRSESHTNVYIFKGGRGGAPTTGRIYTHLANAFLKEPEKQRGKKGKEKKSPGYIQGH
jgi:hypothetical protein